MIILLHTSFFSIKLNKFKSQNTFLLIQSRQLKILDGIFKLLSDVCGLQLNFIKALLKSEKDKLRVVF